jgi:hypothetical protein
MEWRGGGRSGEGGAEIECGIVVLARLSFHLPIRPALASDSDGGREVGKGRHTDRGKAQTEEVNREKGRRGRERERERQRERLAGRL